MQGELSITTKHIQLENIELIKNDKFNIVVVDDEIYNENLTKFNNLKKENKIININLQNYNIEDVVLNLISIINQNKLTNYEYLAKIYDKMQSRINYSMYDDIFEKYINKNDIILELGAGSGNVTKLLLKHSENILISDISENLLKKAKEKLNVKTEVIDINNMNLKYKYDVICMFLDTLNYIDLSYLNNVFKNIYLGLKENGLFIFDIHAENKAYEFDDYVEEVDFEDFKFYWHSEILDEEKIIHNFYFINNEIHLEQHTQYLKEIKHYKQIYNKYFKEKSVIQKDNRYIIVLEKLNLTYE